MSGPAGAGLQGAHEAGACRVSPVPALHLLRVPNLAVASQGALQLGEEDRGVPRRVRRDGGWVRGVLACSRCHCPLPGTHLSLLVAAAGAPVFLPARADRVLPQGGAGQGGVCQSRQRTPGELGLLALTPCNPAGSEDSEPGVGVRHAPVCRPCGCVESGCCAWRCWRLGGAPAASPPLRGCQPHWGAEAQALPRRSRRSCRCLWLPRGGHGRETAACGPCWGWGGGHHQRLRTGSLARGRPKACALRVPAAGASSATS